MHTDWAGEAATGLQDDFDSAVEAFRQALVPYLKGDPKPAMGSFRGARTSRSRIRLALRVADRQKSRRRQQRQLPRLATAPSVISRTCLDTALLTLATLSRLSGPRRGSPIPGISGPSLFGPP